MWMICRYRGGGPHWRSKPRTAGWRQSPCGPAHYHFNILHEMHRLGMSDFKRIASMSSISGNNDTRMRHILHR